MDKKDSRGADTENSAQNIEHALPLNLADQNLYRHLGYFSGTMLNVSQIIGSGIFSSSSFVLANCGSGGMMILLWAIGAIFATAGVWNYLELGTMIPRSGGEQEYLSYQYPKPKELMSFLFMIIVCIFGCSSGLAQGSVVFGSNMVYAIGGPDYKNDWATRGFAVSSKAAITANNIFTILKVLLLVLLICVGLVGLSGRLPNQPDLSLNFSFKGTLKNPGSYANAIYYVISAYGGWSNLNFVMDELVDPIKNLPKCAITALSLVTLLYLLANIAYLSVLPIDTIVNSNATVASNIFNAAFGGIFGSRILPILTGLSSFGAMGALFYAGSRIALEAARKGYLPYDRFFGKVHHRLQTPINSLLLLFFLSLIFLLVPPPGAVFTFIVAFSGYGSHFFSGMAVFGLIVMRKTHPNIERPIKAPIVVSILFIVMCVYTLVFVFIPPTSFNNPYPYWLPYLVTIAIAIVSVGLWYYRVIYKDKLSKSYNIEANRDVQSDLIQQSCTDTESHSTDAKVDEKILS